MFTPFLITIIGVPAIFGAFQLGALLQRRTSDSRDTTRDLPALEDTEHTAEIKSRQALVAQIRRVPLETHSLDEVLRSTTIKGAKLLDADRVTVWGFVSKSTEPILECVCKYDVTTNTHSKGEQVKPVRFPAFHKAVCTGEPILAEDVMSNAATSELATAYLEPNNIVSLLGTSIMLGGRVEGIICHETVGRRRSWHWSDADLADTLGDTVALALDRHRRKQAEQALRRSERRYRELIESAPIGVIVLDLTGTIVEANQYALRLLGAPSLSELVGLDLNEDTNTIDEIWTVAERVLDTGSPQTQEYKWTSRFGKDVHARLHFASHVDEGGRPEGVLTLIEDIFEQRQTERAMRHAQKLESLGLLASGVAHDFNNLLHVILGNAELVKMDLPPESEPVESLNAVTAAAVRASELTGAMLAYAGHGDMAKEVVDLSATVKGTVDLLEHSVTKRISLERHYSPNSVPVSCDTSQIHQVVMNLVLNAVEAHENRPGTVRISTRTEILGSKEILSIPFGSPQPGTFAVFEVKDTGCGMTDEVLAKVFDPFFTTKFTGRGLGMAAVLGIVAQHEGGLSVASTPGVGSAFNVFLPIYIERGDETPMKPSDPVTVIAQQAKYRPRVLLVEDEEEIAAMIERSLRRSNIALNCAKTEQEAINLVESVPFNVMVLDLSLPGKMGEEILQELRSRELDIPVIVVSGHSLREMQERCEGLCVTEFIQKPYSPSGLVDRIIAISDHSDSSAAMKALQ